MPLTTTLTKQMVIEKLNTRTCLKCDGPLVPECVDTQEGSSKILRCIMCGEVVDPVILANRWKRKAA